VGGLAGYEKRNGMEWGILYLASYILLISIGWDIVYLGKEMFSLLVSRSLMCLSYGICIFNHTLSPINEG
jgi:hypothetical protein